METNSSGGILYALRMQGTSLVKVGFTRYRLVHRLKDIQSQLPFSLEVIGQVIVEADARAIEKQMHALLAPHKIRGEWFACDMDSPSFENLVEEAMVSVERRNGRLPNRMFRKSDFPEFALQLYLARQRAGLRVTDLAHRATLSPTILRQMEAGRRYPSTHALRRLAAALGVQADELEGS